MSEAARTGVDSVLGVILLVVVTILFATAAGVWLSLVLLP